MSPAERELRVNLPRRFRVAHHYGWNLQILKSHVPWSRPSRGVNLRYRRATKFPSTRFDPEPDNRRIRKCRPALHAGDRCIGFIATTLAASIASAKPNNSHNPTTREPSDQQSGDAGKKPLIGSNPITWSPKKPSIRASASRTTLPSSSAATDLEDTGLDA